MSQPASRARAERHGPEAIAFYLSGQLLTEDYYVANKLAKGFIGTPHVDTNSRLCMASSVAGHRRAFGADIVPQCYDDLELADLVVLVGSNAAWCHPVLYQRIQMARAERGVRVVNIDPRRTATSEGADLHLAIAPGTDAQLWNGLLGWLSDYSALDRRYIDEHTEGFAAALASAAHGGRTRRRRSRTSPASPAATSSSSTGWWTISERGRHLLFAGRQPVGAGHRQGQRHRQLPPGHGPHRQARRGAAVAHRPAQRHGRARGRRARQHAGRAHGLLGARARSRAPLLGRAEPAWRAKASRPCEMFEAVAAGDIKALWVMGTNPAVSLPRADARARGARAARAAGRLGERRQPTIRRAWRMCGCRPRRGARRTARSPTPSGASRASARSCRSAGRGAARLVDPVAGRAQRLGWAEAFAYRSAADIFREHARLSGFENDGERAFDISGARRPERRRHTTRLAPFQWPVRRAGEDSERLFGDGRFLTPTGRARFVAIEPPRGRAPQSPRPGRSCSIPAACAISGTP